MYFECINELPQQNIFKVSTATNFMELFFITLSTQASGIQDKPVHLGPHDTIHAYGFRQAGLILGQALVYEEAGCFYNILRQFLQFFLVALLKVVRGSWFDAAGPVQDAGLNSQQS